MNKLAVIAAPALLAAVFSCGKDDGKGGSGSDVAETAANTPPDAVRSCKVAAAAPLSLLAAPVTYAGDLYPILQSRCAQCHRGDIENRPNSTNCYYLRDNIANVLKRFDNAVKVDAYLADTNSADLSSPADGDVDVDDALAFLAPPNNERPMPQPQNNNTRTNGRPALTTAEINLFKTWAGQEGKCAEGDPPPELADIPTPTDYSSDEEELSSQNLEKLFATAACQDGPAVNVEANWALASPLLNADAGATSAFYDYGEKAYVEGATAAGFDCTFDGFIASLGGLHGVEETLREYEAYGWRMLQCAVVDGLPRASIGTLSSTVNTLGDTILGINYKTITIDNDPAEPGTPAAPAPP